MPGIRLKYTFCPCNLPVRYEETSSVLDCNSRSYGIDGAKCECAAGKVQKQATHIAALFNWLGRV